MCGWRSLLAVSVGGLCWRSLNSAPRDVLTTRRHDPFFPLAAVADVHDATRKVERQMIPLLALDAVQRQVVLVAGFRHHMHRVGFLRAPQPAPRAIAQIKN